jgi:competence protein ComEA
VTLGIPISLNTASQEGLEAVPYIGPSLAKRIIHYRSNYGPFTAVEQIKSLPGAGKVRYSKISSYVGIQNGEGE